MWSMVYILMFGWLVQGMGAQQSFAKVPADIMVDPGTDAILDCKILNAKGDCLWRKGENTIIVKKHNTHKYELPGNATRGDCSLKIKNTSLADDADWKCEITDAGDGDGRLSPAARFSVRAMPDPPKLVIVGKGKVDPSLRTATTRVGGGMEFSCTSARGNPAAAIKWYIGDEEIPGTNHSKMNDSAKTWSAVSFLKYEFQKSHNRKQLRCVAHHPLTKIPQEDFLYLDIQYAPEVTFKNVPTDDILETVDEVKVACTVDANPPAKVYWRKGNSTTQFPNQEMIEFKPASRTHSGNYFCAAQNGVGKSKEINFALDVKYPPKINRMQLPLAVPVTLYENATLECHAEGNPLPKYEWWQSMIDSSGAESIWIPRGNESTLQLLNVTYMDQGKFICKVTNTIAGKEHFHQNDLTRLTVKGPPQILRQRETAEAKTGGDALLKLQFCSDPMHDNVTWEWGSSKLKPGHKQGKFTARAIAKTTLPTCYEAVLHIDAIDHADSRHYYLRVDNRHGHDQYSLNLQVTGVRLSADPLSMTAVLAFIIVALVFLAVVLALIMYAFLCSKWCFTRRGGYTPNSDLDSNAEKNGGINGSDKSNGKEKSRMPPSPSPQSEIHYIKSPTKLPRPTTPISHPHLLTKQQIRQLDTPMRNHQFETIITEEMLRYSDLQVPKISNNGSMRKLANGNHYTKIPATPPPLLSFNRYDIPAPTPSDADDSMFKLHDSTLKGFEDLQEDEV